MGSASGSELLGCEEVLMGREVAGGRDTGGEVSGFKVAAGCTDTWGEEELMGKEVAGGRDTGGEVSGCKVVAGGTDPAGEERLGCEEPLGC